MKIDFLLKNEGIEVVKELSKKEVSTIAKDVAIKLCLAFPEHNLSRLSLYNALSLLKMYYANLPKDFSGAKYILDNSSIYFNSNLPFENIPSTAMHECIHFIQHYNSTQNFGLVTSSKHTALNEAAVQLMASEANMNPETEVKYFDIDLKTISPDFYPLECSLLNQITYFTGTYPLYNSVIYSNDVFKNTFTTKFSKNAYLNIIKRLDSILNLETEINCYIEEMINETNSKSIKKLDKIINYKKQKIMTVFFQAQNYIMRTCFMAEFNTLRNYEDIHNFKNKLYDYKNIIGCNENYSYYNVFYRSMMNLLETKKEQIKASGEINLLSNKSTALTIIDTRENKLKFIKILFKKIKELFKSEVSKDYINE